MGFKTLEREREYQREWRRKNRTKNLEKRREQDRRRWKTTRRYAIRRKRLGKLKCMFCEVLLASKSVKVRSKKFCDRCLADPRVKRYLCNLYIRRWRQKKAGLPQEPVEFRKIPYRVGRPPKKSLIPLEGLDKQVTWR